MDLRRLELQALLEATLATDNVYFQPPANVNIQYPCIVYKRDRSETQFAGNRPYHSELRYQVTVIHPDADNDIYLKVRDLPKTIHIRSFVADNLHHDVFNLVF